METAEIASLLKKNHESIEEPRHVNHTVNWCPSYSRAHSISNLGIGQVFLYYFSATLVK